VIPVRSGVNADLLHPIFRRRLDALAADPRTGGRLSIYSGVRTYAHQKQLYDDYVAGRRDDVAANPDRVLGERTYFGLTGIVFGSMHMAQERLGGWGYAADLAGYDAGTEAIAREYGLIRTVPSEMWHYQPSPAPTPYDHDEEHPLMALTDAEQADLLDRTKRIDGELDQVLAALRTITDRVERLQERVTKMDERVADKGVKLTEWQRDDLAKRIKAS